MNEVQLTEDAIDNHLISTPRGSLREKVEEYLGIRMSCLKPLPRIVISTSLIVNFSSIFDISLI